ncbi:MAG: hypothetical protein R2744_13535 [Bacteroidales bacterium]
MASKHDGVRITDIENEKLPGVKNFTIGGTKLSDGRIWFTTYGG